MVQRAFALSLTLEATRINGFNCFIQPRRAAFDPIQNSSGLFRRAVQHGLIGQ
jgi:hypothetical protein